MDESCGNVADVYLEDGKYFCYLNGKKLCQSKKILDIEMLLLVKKWTKKARDANVSSLNFHFDEKAARDAETPVIKKEVASSQIIITRNKNVTCVIPNDDAPPSQKITPSLADSLRKKAIVFRENRVRIRKSAIFAN